MATLLSLLGVAWVLLVSGWATQPQGHTAGFTGFGCGLLHLGNRCDCLVVTEGDGVRPAEVYKASYGVIHAELLSRYERVPLRASKGIKVRCRDLEPFTMKFRTCRLSEVLRYPGGESINQRSETLHRIAGKLSEGRLEFVKESAENAMTVRCVGLPEFWVKAGKMCRLRNAKMRRIAGLAKEEPLKRIYRLLLDGKLEKVNSLLPSAILVRCAGVLPLLVQPTHHARQKVE